MTSITFAEFSILAVFSTAIALVSLNTLEKLRLNNASSFTFTSIIEEATEVDTPLNRTEIGSLVTAFGKGILKRCVFSILKLSSKNHCVPAAIMFISSFSKNV